MGLSDLIHKCLRTDPRDRYSDAAALAGDLRRHLNHLPLEGRAEPESDRALAEVAPAAAVRPAPLPDLPGCRPPGRSRRRHCSRWLIASGSPRSRPRWPTAAATCGTAQYVRGARDARARPGPGRLDPRLRELEPDLDEELRAVLRDRKAAELHRLADLVRFRYGLAPKPSEEAHDAARPRSRDLGRPAACSCARLPAGMRPELERAIRTDLLDFITVWADLRVRLAPGAEVGRGPPRGARAARRGD